MNNNPNMYPRTEDSMHDVLLQLSGNTRSRFRRFLNRPEFVGMRPTDIINILLDREEEDEEEELNRVQTRQRSPLKRRRPNSPRSNYPPQLIPQVHQQQDPRLQQQQEASGTYKNIGQVPTISPRKRIPYHHHHQQQVQVQSAQGDEEEEELVDEFEDADYDDGGEEGDILEGEEEIINNNNSSYSRRSIGGKKQFHPERKGVGTGKQKSWTSNLRRYLYDIIVKWQRDDCLHCRECDRWMRVVHKSCGLRCGNALDHVCAHMGKPMYACRLCAHQSVTSVQMRKHLKQVHQRTNDFDDLTDTFFAELADRIARCFDYSKLGEPPTGARRLLTYKKKPGETGVGKSYLTQYTDLNSSSVRRFIYELIAKWQKDSALYCRQCDHWVRLGNETSWAQTQAALAHVCGHFGQFLYACLICKERTKTCNQMIRHIRHVHQTISRGNCSEEIDEHQAELKTVATACFDWNEGEQPPDISKDGPFLKKKRNRSGEETPRRRKQDNSCRLEALEFARRLIKAYSSKDSLKMQCQKCETESTVKSAKGVPRPEVMFDHVMRHLDTDGYACRHCTKTAKTSGNMRVHVTSTHKEAATTDYEDKTGEMKEVILEMLKQCYDASFKEPPAVGLAITVGAEITVDKLDAPPVLEAEEEPGTSGLN